MEEDIRKIAQEELAKQIRENIDSALIFNYISNLEKEIEKKDKIIDEMAQFIWEEDTIFRLPDDVTTPEEVKEYFKKKEEG